MIKQGCSHTKLEWGCPNGTNTLRGNQFKISKFFNHEITDLRAYPWLMWSLWMKFHDCMCKGKAIMSQLLFSVINAVTLTFWPRNWYGTFSTLGEYVCGFMMIGVKGKQLCANYHLSNQCIVTLTFKFDLMTQKLIGHILDSWGVCVKFHDDMCKEKAIMCQLRFSIINAL